jgi:hypothetical protein
MILRTGGGRCENLVFFGKLRIFEHVNDFESVNALELLFQNIVERFQCANGIRGIPGNIEL